MNTFTKQILQKQIQLTLGTPTLIAGRVHAGQDRDNGGAAVRAWYFHPEGI